MKRLIVSVVAILVCVGLLAAQAQSKGRAPEKYGQKIEKAKAGSISGTVVSSTSDSLVIKTKRGEMTFLLDSKIVRPTNLETGAIVTVRYKKEGDKNLAIRITPSRKKKV